MMESDNLHADADGKKDENLSPQPHSENPEESTGEEIPKTMQGEAAEGENAEGDHTPEAEADMPEAEPEKTEDLSAEKETAPETSSTEEETMVEEESVAEEEVTSEKVEKSEVDKPDTEEVGEKEAPSEELSPEKEITTEKEEVTETQPAEEEITAEVAEKSEGENKSDSKETKTKEEGEDYHAEEEEEEPEEEEEIAFKNYSKLPLEVLVGEARELLKNHAASKLREHFSLIRDAVKRLTDKDEKQKRAAFEAEGGDKSDFHYDNPEAREFHHVYGDFRRQLDTFFKEREKEQKENLKERLQLIDELKSLYTDSNEDNSNIFKKFRDIKTRWHNAGLVPKAQAGNVFRTYFFHLDNFYKYLDMNKELREMDYTHNLEVRHSIIKRAEELVGEENVQKALNELQYLHRLWKEEAVPVAEEFREPTWAKFKELTHKIHERKTELNEKIKEEQEENLKLKRQVLQDIHQLSEEAESKSHRDWQQNIKKLNVLRDKFLGLGRVPREFNQQMWDEFKGATRKFNHAKNDFYKKLKAEQQINLDKKRKLLEIAREHAQSTDWNTSVQVVKRIQAEWKTIGHVPRKYSDAIWKDFKEACNQFFNAYKSRNDEANKNYEDNLKLKEELLEELKAFKPGENVKESLSALNEFNLRWSNIGRIPGSRMGINNDFSKTVSRFVRDLGLSEEEIKDFRMASLVKQIESDQDERRLDDEIRKTRKLMDDLEKEINQLETNVAFFSNADESNPILKDVYHQIEEKRKRLGDAEFRLRKLHQIDFEEEEEETSENSGQTPGDE